MKIPRNSDRDSWLGHEYTQTVAHATRKEMTLLLQTLLGAAESSTDAKVVRAAVRYKHARDLLDLTTGENK